MHRPPGPAINGATTTDRSGSRRIPPVQARVLLRRALLTALLGIAAAMPTIAAPSPIPALLDPANQERHIGKLIFVELVTPDLAAARQFYAGLFGWTFRDIPVGESQYAEAYLDGHPVAGLFQRGIQAGEHRQPAWLNFFSVGDVDAAAKIALQNGAKVLVPPRTVPDLGREAIFADPQGAVFAILASSSGDPPDVLAEPGGWIWSSLMTRDPDAAVAIYKALFGFEIFDLPTEEGARHLLLATENYARASANTLPANLPNAHPHWLSYVRVVDAEASAAKVVTLGGRVLVEPRVDRHGGKVAVVSDPMGAPFGLLEWRD